MRGGFTLDRLEKLNFSLLYLFLKFLNHWRLGFVVERCKYYSKFSESREDADEQRSCIVCQDRRATICWSLLIHLWESGSSRASVLKTMFTIMTMENLYLLPAQLIGSLGVFCRTAASSKCQNVLKTSASYYHINIKHKPWMLNFTNLSMFYNFFFLYHKLPSVMKECVCDVE